MNAATVPDIFSADRERKRQELAKVIYEAWTLRPWLEPQVHTALDCADAVLGWIEDEYE